MLTNRFTWNYLAVLQSKSASCSIRHYHKEFDFKDRMHKIQRYNTSSVHMEILNASHFIGTFTLCETFAPCCMMYEHNSNWRTHVIYMFRWPCSPCLARYYGNIVTVWKRQRIYTIYNMEQNILFYSRIV